MLWNTCKKTNKNTKKKKSYILFNYNYYKYFLFLVYKDRTIYNMSIGKAILFIISCLNNNKETYENMVKTKLYMD